MKITVETKLCDIYNMPELSSCKHYLVTNEDENFTTRGQRTLVDMNKDTPPWGAEDIAYGLNRLLELTSGEFLYNVYDDVEIKRCKEKKEVVLFHFPANSDNKMFALIIAGGGYTSVCSLAEGFPIAAKLNELGITAFVLNYRTKKMKLFPRPTDDIAAALAFIAKNADKFNVDPEKYMTFGFSAGGHLAAIWGTNAQGYGKYGFKKPVLSCLGYPVVSSKKLTEGMPFYAKLAVKTALVGLFAGKEKLNALCVDENVDENYSPCFIVHSKDDPMVSPKQTMALVEQLEKYGVPHKVEWQEKGGHGFGLATNNELNGWVERAVAFIEK